MSNYPAIKNRKSQIANSVTFWNPGRERRVTVPEGSATAMALWYYWKTIGVFGEAIWDRFERRSVGSVERGSGLQSQIANQKSKIL